MYNGYNIYAVICMEETTIRITVETRDRLKKLGKKGETYDKIIRRLLDKQK